jgi:radical SAM protein with 4Fe4S-binding SPASM domain
VNKLQHILRLGWAYEVRRATRLHYPPYQYTIEPTNSCNLRCPFCPQSDPDHAHRRPAAAGQLTEENFRIFLNRLREAHPANRNLNFTLDGEPFLNRHFIPFVQLAAEAGYFSIFATNATLLDPSTADRLVAAGPFRASIDFAARQEVFESIRGRAGDYERVLENLRYLMEQSRRHRGVHVDVHDIATYMGADPAASLAELRALFPADLPSRIRFDTRIFHNFCGHLPMERSRAAYRLCPYPWTQMAVAHNGDVVACCRDTVGRSVLGNAFRQPVMQIWNGDTYQRFRQNLIDRHPERNAACRDCDLPWSAGQARWRWRYVLRSLTGR